MLKNNTGVSITFTVGTVIKIMTVLLIGFSLYLLLDLVLVILTSVVIASAVEPATRWFAHYKIPRIPAVLIVYIVSFLVILAFLYIFIPPLLTDVSRLSNDLPDQLESMEFFGGLFEPITTIPGFDPVLNIESLFSELRQSLGDFSGGALNTAATLFGGAFSFVMILVISFYLAVQEKGLDDFLRLITPLQYEKYVLSLWRRSQAKIGQWMKGQILLGFIVGVLVFLGLTILGVRFAFILAVLAAVLELIPIFGPIISAVPAILIGFTNSPTTGLMVIGLYVIIQQFENHLIYPLVVKKIVGLSPIVVILALIVGGQLFGFLGLLLAVPIATVLMELASDEQKRKLSALNDHSKI